MSVKFAFYGRVSTEDNQDPVASRGWQLRRATDLIAATGGEVVAEFFDVGHTRALPWKRRPESARLLDLLSDPSRGFDAVVIGEPQRAFHGTQFGMTLPVFSYHRVALWVPKVGGPVDPDSEAHDLVMTLFGGMSKGERTRVKIRVRTAMEVMASDTSRFLGGRPPYGYRLVDAGPHPNPGKAADGKRLHRLVPDPTTAPVVVRIFRMYAGGAGLRSIADTLTNEGVLSPSAYDQARNSHRDGRGWAHSAIRAILDNPTYAGRRVWAKQRRQEELLDVNDVAAGDVTRMRWQPASDWIEGVPDHEALVDAATVAAVASRLGRKPDQTRTRATPHPYLLRGLIRCGLCGRKLQGAARRRKTSPPKILYRCEFGSDRAIPATLDHPASVYIPEDVIVDPLDRWLAEIVTPESLAASQQVPPDVAARNAAAVAKIADSDKRIGRLVASVEDGTVPAEWIAAQVAKLRGERDQLDQSLIRQSGYRPLSPTEISTLSERLGGLVRALNNASPAERARVYADLGVHLIYDPAANEVRATADLARVGRRVGGGT